MDEETQGAEPTTSDDIEEVEETPEEQEPETPEESTEPDLDSKLEEEAEARRQLTARAKKAEQEKKRLQAEIESLRKSKSPLDVEDYIDISAALDGLDQREKQFLAEQHRLSGRNLNEIRKSEDFSLWQSAYRQKVEKEKQALKPSSTQVEEDRPKSVTERIRSAKTLAEKERIMSELGLYKNPKASKPGGDGK